MTMYIPPLRDILFVIRHVLDAPEQWRQVPAFADLDGDTASQVVEQAGRFAAEVLAPTNRAGDHEGCTLREGGVGTPAGFAAAYQAFVDGGWPSLACDPAYGGQGLPKLLEAALYEMLLSANHAWAMYPGLLHGAYDAVRQHGSPALRDRYLPQLIRGEALAAMSLTEPQAGSDLGLVATRAFHRPDGSLSITGSKIFISGGDHDMTANVIHLVLCRLPDAPPGTKGLSLALVPKILPDGRRNAFSCVGLEEKMGIHGSATCAMRYEEATGWLVGDPHRGLAAMFVMMNSARLHVALQGLGHLEGSRQLAMRYAHERQQMRAPARPADVPRLPPDPIAWHPAVRRTLWTLNALTEGQRVAAYWTAMLLDEAEHHPSEARRRQASQRAAVLTPVLKAFLTHHGFHGSSAALQVFGGYGYVAEYGVEQHMRDARITMIYEGTNEIQAIDLLMRKVLPDRGEALLELLSEFEATASRCDGDLAPLGMALGHACALARQGIAVVLQAGEEGGEAVLPVADDFLMGVGYMLMAWAWCRIALAARDLTDKEWAAQKLTLARFGLTSLIHDGSSHWEKVRHLCAPLPWLVPEG